MKEQEITEEVLKKKIAKMTVQIDRDFSQLLSAFETGFLKEPIENRTISLLEDDADLTGRKPLFVQFQDGTSVHALTWTEVIKVVLQHCCEDEIMHERLSKLCGCVAGRKRFLLSSQKENLKKPVEVTDGIYFEGCMSKSSVIRFLTKQILDRIGYDYSGISVINEDRPIALQIQNCKSPEKIAEIKENIRQNWAVLRNNLQEIQQELDEALQEETAEISEELEETEEAGIAQQM